MRRKPRVEFEISKLEIDDVTDMICSLFPSPIYVPIFDEPPDCGAHIHSLL